jgi:hypothetical protein
LKDTYTFTYFNAKRTKDNKIPFSPTDDNRFTFQNFSSDDLVKIYTVIVSNWILNIPLAKLTGPIMSFRRKVDLDKYYKDEINYFVLDIDKVTSLEHRDFILNYFKEHKCIIGQSKSYDGISNFNMKGIMIIDTTSMHDAKACISHLNHMLKDYCDIDESVSRKVSLNAPIGKHIILLNNQDKEPFKCQVQAVQSTHIEDGYVEVQKKEKIKVELDDIHADTIEKYCLEVFKNMGFISIKVNDNNSISFKHPTEEKSSGGYFWFEASPYTMHHPNSVRTINIFDAVKKTDLGKELMKVELDYNDAFLNYDTNTQIINVDEQYLLVKGKEQYIHNFLTSRGGLFSIKSPMGTGKSNIINHIIEESHELDYRVLIITNRRSVAADFARKYGMKVYNKDLYNVGDSLIVQFDSLWRYDMKKFDIVIMDEFISLMMHSRNNLGNSSLNIAKFFGAFNKKLVIADAFLTGYENFLLDSKKENIFQLNNTWRDKTILHNYEDKNFFIMELLKKAKTNKITVSGTSLVFLNSTRALLEKQGLNVVLLTAETADQTKEIIYDLFEKEEHDKWDVFMYSPTLTVGVSNLNNVYDHFHFDSSKSTDVISSIQMIKRTRKAKNIHMYIAESTRFLKITYNSIRDEYMSNMGRNVDQNYLFDIDDYGEAKLSKIGRNAVKIDTFKNIMEFNHKEGMLWMMKYHFLHEPRNVKETYSENIIGHYSKILKNDKDILLLANIKEFLSLNTIERTGILLDSNNATENAKLMKILIEIDEHIKSETDDIIRTQIIKIALKNKDFVKQCKFYKHTIDFVRGFSNLDDIKVQVSKAVIANSDDLIFYNQLIRYGQVPFDKNYQNKPTDKLLIYILDKIGYKFGSFGKTESLKDISCMSESEKTEHIKMSNRVYRINPDILDYYGFIR